MVTQRAGLLVSVLSPGECLWYEGIRLMQADRRIQPDECTYIYIYMSIYECFVCVKGRINALDFPEAFFPVINLSLNVTSKNCSCVCSFLPSLHCRTYTYKSGRSSRSFIQVCKKPDKNRPSVIRSLIFVSLRWEVR